eukprot:5872023-Amphidinium_carterae.1
MLDPTHPPYSYAPDYATLLNCTGGIERQRKPLHPVMLQRLTKRKYYTYVSVNPMTRMLCIPFSLSQIAASGRCLGVLLQSINRTHMQIVSTPPFGMRQKRRISQSTICKCKRCAANKRSRNFSDLCALPSIAHPTVAHC